jgi:fimbrial chaperone protein
MRFNAMRGLFFALVLAVGTLYGSSASAGSVDVSPTSITLSAKATSGMLALTNRGTAPMRFHVTAFAWDEKPDGEMVLTPTKDIMFFPAMLTLNPQEARNLRVGTNIPPGAAEKTYRVFIQELPALARVNEENAAAVAMLTKMGVPVFVEGTSNKAEPSVGALTLQGQKLGFQLKNSGGKHFRTEKLTLRARDAADKVIHSQDLNTWYVLAGHTTTYEVTLPIELCGSMKSLDVELRTTEQASRTARLPNATCTR